MVSHQIALLLVLLFFKELKIATFDAGLAATLGFSPVLVHYGLMTTVSVTTVGSFSAVGAILVVALMLAGLEHNKPLKEQIRKRLFI